MQLFSYKKLRTEWHMHSLVIHFSNVTGIDYYDDIDNVSDIQEIQDTYRTIKTTGHCTQTVYLNILALACSAFFLWICSIRTRLFLKTLPLHFMYRSWYLHTKHIRHCTMDIPDGSLVWSTQQVNVHCLYYAYSSKDKTDIKKDSVTVCTQNGRHFHGHKARSRTRHCRTARSIMSWLKWCQSSTRRCFNWSTSRILVQYSRHWSTPQIP